MIAIAAISEKLATIAARLTVACPGAARSWPRARRSGGCAGSGSWSKTKLATSGPAQSRPAAGRRSRRSRRPACRRPGRAARARRRRPSSARPGQSGAMRCEQRLLVARLERAGRRRARGVERRQQRAEHGDDDAGEEVGQRAARRLISICGATPRNMPGAEVGAGQRAPPPARARSRARGPAAAPTAPSSAASASTRRATPSPRQGPARAAAHARRGGARPPAPAPRTRGSRR